MGYLDKQSRVVDVVLTVRGRQLYAAGELDFAYFGLFDDGIDYDPWSTGFLTQTDRELQIEATPMLEPMSVPDRHTAVSPGEPVNHLFTAAAGFELIPQMQVSPSSSLLLMGDQRSSGGTYRRTGTSFAQMNLSVLGDTQPGNPGFIIRVYSSGSNGLQQLGVRRDLNGRRSYDPFLAVSVDREKSIDGPAIGNPTNSRSQAGNTKK